MSVWFARTALLSVVVPLALAPIVRGRNLSLDSVLDSGPEALTAASSAITWLYRGATLAQIVLALALMLYIGGSSHRKLKFNAPLLFSGLGLVLLAHTLNAVFGTEGGYAHQVTYSAVIIVACCCSGRQQDQFVAARIRFNLFRDCLAFIVGLGLVMIALKPSVVVQTNYVGGLLPFRFWGVCGHANSMGALAAIFIVCTNSRPYQGKISQSFAYCAGMTSVILAQSKTAIVALLLALGFMHWYRSRDIRVESGNGATIGFVVALVLVAFGALVFIGEVGLSAAELAMVWADSSQGQEILSLTNRTTIWQLAIDTWLDAPVFGYGNTAFGEDHRFILRMPFALHAHNQYLQTLASSGILGFTSLVCFLLALGRSAYMASPFTRGASIAIFTFILVRTITEVPIDLRTPVTVDNLVLFGLMLVVSAVPYQRSRSILGTHGRTHLE